VVFAQNNMEELSILEHEGFRKEMGELGFAEIWVSPSFDHVFNFEKGAGKVFNDLMERLANVSGYTELRFAPVVYIGHSATASAPYYFAAWNPERTLAAISVSGQWPFFRHAAYAPDIWRERTIDYLPCLETMGEYEAADTWSAEGLKERREHPLMPLSMLACPAEGHFAVTDKKVKYLAFYIRKAVQYRMPKNYQENSPPKLIPIDPTKTGWLAEKWKANETPSVPSAPIGSYKGDPAQAFWFFDGEHVRETEKYQSAYRNRKVQLLGIVQEGKLVSQENTHQQVDLKFIPLRDGLTFRLEGTFLDTVPGESPRPAAWTGLPAGTPIGNAGKRQVISIDKIIGPFEKIDATTFAIRMQKESGPDLKKHQMWFAVTHPGNDKYRPGVQQAKMEIPAINEKGRPQRISFPEIADQKLGTKAVKLRARTDSGLQVHYFVLEGPAEMEGNRLRFTQIPPRAKFPLRVTAVAWQWGSTREPFIKSAETVFKTFYLLK
jgi:hypothetical protein